MLSLHYHELMGKTEELEGKKYLMMGDYMLDKTIGKSKEIIDMEQFGDTKILIDTDDELPDDIFLKTVMIIMTCAIQDHDKFHPQLFLEEGLLC